MKTQAVQSTRLSNSKITLDPALDGLHAGKVLFPKKHTLARQTIEKHGLPPMK